MVALCEEIVFRGLIMQNTFLYLKIKIHDVHKAAFLSIMISSLLFALSHLSNISVISKRAVMVQITGAFIYGILFGFITYETRSLLSAVILHGFNDIASAFAIIILNTGNSAADVINSYGLMDIIALLPVGIYCILLYRKLIKA